MSVLLNTLCWVVLLNLSAGILKVEANSKCLVPTEDKDFDNYLYFRYCSDNDGVRKLKSDKGYLCKEGDKLKFENFKAFYVENNEMGKACKTKMTRFTYKYVVNTSCLPQAERNSIMKPFLQGLSGQQDVETVENFRPDFNIKYKQISLEYACEKEDAKKVDMCNIMTTQFQGDAEVSLYFNAMKYRNYDDHHPSCYCYFKSLNSTLNIKAQAYDIRLHTNNQLLVNHRSLDPNEIYWWQSGLLTSSSLHRLTLSGLHNDTLPTSVWIDISGRNLEITCGLERLPDKEIDNNTQLPHSRSDSSSSFGLVHIIVTILGIIVFIIVVAVVVKCLCSRRSNASKSDKYQVNAPETSECLSPHNEEDEESDEQPEGDYAVVIKKPGRKSGGDDIELQHLTDREEHIDTNSPSSPHKITHTVLTHDIPEENSTYNHLPDFHRNPDFRNNPDVIPSSNCHIYDTTGQGDYASLSMTRQQSKVDNTIYDDLNTDK